MSLWTSIKAKFEGQAAYAPAAIAAFAAAGITLNPDGSVVMPDGTTGTFMPASGTIQLSDGSDVALPNAVDRTNVPVTSPSPPIDISAWWRGAKAEVEGLTIGGVVGAGVGAGVGFSLAGPIGARVGAAIVGPLGAWIGYKVG